MNGIEKRLARILRTDGKTVIVPMDHGVTLGPVVGLGNMRLTISNLLGAKVDAFVDKWKDKPPTNNDPVTGNNPKSCK